ncbi:MAG TPA: phosphatase PAP2 family protein [Feifaniaceae bacterium]|nr:phosphatase PAP2 family protein [Feifaniaceae bacterium]
MERYTAPHYWISYLPLDDYIPFVDFFVVFYCMWYAYVIGTGFFLMFADVPVFCRFMRHMMIGLIASLLICFLFPNAQELRPDTFEKHTVFTAAVQAIYSADTNTNVLPSMHVVGAFAAAAAACKSAKFHKAMKWFMAVLAVLICVSTVLIKQHSVLDLFAGVLLSVPAYFLAYSSRHTGKDAK